MGNQRRKGKGNLMRIGARVRLQNSRTSIFDLNISRIPLKWIKTLAAVVKNISDGGEFYVSRLQI